MKDPLKSIVCCGFTPCVQRILEYGAFEKKAVNRALKVTIGIGGKGANTARMVRQLGATPLLVEFAGGANGQLLENLLAAESVDFKHVHVAGETRICQTLIEQNSSEPTELVEEMPPVSALDWGKMFELLVSIDLRDAVVPISGKLPAGAPKDAYAQIAALVARQGGRILLDAPGEPLLLALKHNPFVVKINDEELLGTLGGGDVRVACRSLIERGAQSVLITRGSRSAFFMSTGHALELFPPEIDAVNPVGSGDAVTAGMAVLLSGGSSVKEAVVHGMACGAANALTLRSGVLALDEVDRLRLAVRVEALGMD